MSLKGIPSRACISWKWAIVTTPFVKKKKHYDKTSNTQGSTLTVVNWTSASKNQTLACKSLETQAILAWRNSLKCDFTFQINWELFAYVTFKISISWAFEMKNYFKIWKQTHKWMPVATHEMWMSPPCLKSAMLARYFVLELVLVDFSPSQTDEINIFNMWLPLSPFCYVLLRKLWHRSGCLTFSWVFQNKQEMRMKIKLWNSLN